MLVTVDSPESRVTAIETFVVYKVVTKVSRRRTRQWADPPGVESALCFLFPQTARSEFDSCEYEVLRRYQDFLWLRSRLEESHPSLIVPVRANAAPGDFVPGRAVAYAARAPTSSDWATWRVAAEKLAGLSASSGEVCDERHGGALHRRLHRHQEESPAPLSQQDRRASRPVVESPLSTLPNRSGRTRAGADPVPVQSSGESQIDVASPT